jgi:hypothetical protein
MARLPITQPLVNHHIRVQHGIVTDRHTVANHAARVQDHVLAKTHAFADHDVFADTRR